MIPNRTKAEIEYDEALGLARLPFGDPDRLPYPVAVKDALAAWDFYKGNATTDVPRPGYYS